MKTFEYNVYIVFIDQDVCILYMLNPEKPISLDKSFGSFPLIFSLIYSRSFNHSANLINCC